MTGITTYSLLSGQLLLCLEKCFTIFNLKCSWLLFRTASHVDAGRPQAWLALSFSDRLTGTHHHDSCFSLPYSFLLQKHGILSQAATKPTSSLLRLSAVVCPSEGSTDGQGAKSHNLEISPFFFPPGPMRNRISSSQGACFSPSLSPSLSPDVNCSLYNLVSPPGQQEFPAATSQPDYKSF